MNYKISKIVLFGEEQTVLHRYDDDGAIWGIPFSEDNSDYIKYINWLKEGNHPEYENADIILDGEK